MSSRSDRVRTDGGLFARLMQIFGGAGDPARQKRRLLKAIGKDVRRSGGRLYDVKSSRLGPAFGRILYRCYAIAGPAQTLLRNAGSSEGLKAILVEQALSSPQREAQNELNDERLAERLESLKAQEFADHVRKNLRRFFESFDTGLTQRINLAYDNLKKLIDLLYYDFHYLLKRFDPRLPDNDFVYKPRLGVVQGQLVADELKDLLAVIELPEEVDWAPTIEALGVYRENAVTEQSVARLQAELQPLIQDRLLEKIIMLIEQDPSPVRGVAEQTKPELIVQSYLENFRADVERRARTLLKERRERQIRALGAVVIGAIDPQQLRNYNESADERLKALKTDGFRHAVAMAYLRTFLLESFKRDIGQLIDLFVIKGQWVNAQIARDLADAYRALVERSKAIGTFDDDLDRSGELGSKLAGAISRAARNKAFSKQVQDILNVINSRAGVILKDCADKLAVVHERLGTLGEDVSFSRGSVLLNWQQIKWEAATLLDSQKDEVDLKDVINAAFKQIGALVRLIRGFV